MADKILVGRFGAPHGVRGEMRLQSFTGEPRAIADYGPLQAADGRRFELAGVRSVKDNMLVARVTGVMDRDAAAALTNLELYVARSALPPPDEDEFYVADLVGMSALDGEGRMLGTVVDVPNYGGGDLVELRPPRGGETMLLPFTKDVVPTIDFAGRILMIVPPKEVSEDGPEAGA